MHTPNDVIQNNLFCRLHFVVETFGNSTKWTNQSKFNKRSKDDYKTSVIISPMSTTWYNYIQSDLQQFKGYIVQNISLFLAYQIFKSWYEFAFICFIIKYLF